MAEDERVEETPEARKDTGETFKKTLKIICGIILVALGVWGIIACWEQVWIIIRGCFGAFLVLAGLICFLLAAE